MAAGTETQTQGRQSQVETGFLHRHYSSSKVKLTVILILPAAGMAGSAEWKRWKVTRETDKGKLTVPLFTVPVTVS
ncbi:hypothetical protein RQ025_004796, partial [Salmonella enterica]|nr:hypothetical protein [Salmonella enterica]